MTRAASDRPLPEVGRVQAADETPDARTRKPAMWKTGEVFVGRTRHGWSLWKGVTCIECAGCGFTFAEDHEDTDRDGYTCPNCGARSADVVDD